MYETERLILRDWIDSDIEPFVVLNQDPEVMEFFPNVRTREESFALIDKSKQHLLQYGYSMYACELKETYQFIGVVGLIHCDSSLPVTPNIEIAW